MYVCIIYVHFIVSFSQLISYHTPKTLSSKSTKKRRGCLLAPPPERQDPLKVQLKKPLWITGIRPRHMMLWVEWELKTWIQRRRSIDVTSVRPLACLLGKGPFDYFDQVSSGRFVEKSWMITTNGSLKNWLVGGFKPKYSSNWLIWRKLQISENTHLGGGVTRF